MDINVDFLNNTQEIWYNSPAFIALVSAIFSSIIPISLTFYINKKQDEGNKEIQKEISETNKRFQEDLNNKNNDFQRELSERNNEIQEKMLQKEIDANVISQSIVNWLAESRTFSTEFVAAGINCLKNYNMASSLYNNGAEEIFKKENMKLGEIRIDEANKYKEKANSNREDAIKYLAQFELQFGINSENQKLVDQAHQILDLINKIVEILEFYTLKILDSQEPQAPFPEVMKTIANYADYYITDIFVKNCRLYYKREWDKAKGVNSGKGLLHYVEVDENNGYVKSYRERLSLIESIVDGATIT